MKKQWWTSKTLYTAAGAFLVALGGEIFANPEIARLIETGAALITPLLMFALRLVTKSGIGT